MSSNMFHTCQKVVFFPLWQAQCFCNLHRHFAWQARHFRRVASRVFFSNCIVRAASSGDTVQIPWQVWHFVRCAENRKPRTKHRFWGCKFWCSIRKPVKRRFWSYTVWKLEDVSNEMLVLMLQRVSPRVSGFPPTSPCLWGSCKTYPGSRCRSKLDCGFACQVCHFMTFSYICKGVENHFVWQSQYFCVVFRRWVAFSVAGAAFGSDPSCAECYFAWQAQYFGRSTHYTLHSTLYIPHFILYTLLSTLHTPHSNLYTPHSTLHTFHFTLYTLHSTLLTLHYYSPHFTLHTFHFTLYTFALHTLHFTLQTLHFTLHTPHSTLNTPHSTLYTFTLLHFYTIHFTLHTLHFTLHTLHFTLYSPHSTLYTLHSTLHTLHFTFYTPHFTLDTLHVALHTPHSTLYTLHFTLHTLHFTHHTPRSTLYAPPHSTLHTLHSTLYTPHSTLYTLQPSSVARGGEAPKK